MRLEDITDETKKRIKDQRNVFVLIGSGAEESDKELFFGPLQENDIFVEAGDDVKMFHLMGSLGFFRSNSEARKNGWNKDVEDGFSEFKIGKKKIELTILKILK